MSATSNQEWISSLIADKSAELGSVGAALAFVHHHLLDTLPPDIANVFPLRGPQRLPGRLCRCRGMIQEVESNISLYRASPGDFFGAATVSGESSDTDGALLLEATRLYVIPVPGNPHFYGTDGTAAAAAAAAEGRPAEARAERKRSGRPEGTAGLEGKAPGRHRCDPPLPSSSPSASSFAVPQRAGDTPLYAQLNIPHPPLSTDLLTACIVTVIHHEGEKQRRLCINDVVDFIGFLNDVPAGTVDTDERDEFEGFGSWHAEELPLGLLAHMTCVAWQHLFESPKEPPSSSFFELKRPLVVQHFTNTICEGDAILAEYLLLHLSARVIAHASATPVGDLPLCVQANTEIDVAGWSSFLRNVAPVGEILFDTELFSRCDLRFVPAQDHERNILQTGVLQVANGTHITMDARVVSIAAAKGGTLQDSLFAAIHKQVLLLEYPFQVQELPVDLSFLALSTVDVAEEVPLLRFAVTVKWLPQSPAPAALLSVLKDEEVRHYMDAVRCVDRTFDTNSERVSHLAESLVDFSKSEPAWNNRDPLIHNNSFSTATALMRAHAASLGRDTITHEDVVHVLSLERSRMARAL